MEESQRYDLQGTPATAPDLEVNVDDFGAVGDGKTDDTEVRAINNVASNRSMYTFQLFD